MHWFKKKKITRVSTVIASETTDQIIEEGNGSQSVSTHGSDVSLPGHVTSPHKRNCCQRCCTKENLKDQALLIATIVSVVLGVVVGIALRDLKCPTGKNKTD
jgi:uncharacterized paraquat-inducible protein A